MVWAPQDDPYSQFDRPIVPIITKPADPARPFQGRIAAGQADAAQFSGRKAATDVRQSEAQTRKTEATLPYDIRRSRAEAESAEIKALTDRQKALAKRGDVVAAREELLRVVEAAANAHRYSRNKNATGWGSFMYGWMPTSIAHDMQGELDTIAGNIAFERLQKMREESPTGGALGSVSAPELVLLKSSITSLDPTRSRAAFQKSMKRVLDVYAKILGKLPGGKEAYRDWRKQWLGFDPNQKQQPRQSARGNAVEAEQYLRAAGVK